MEKREQVFVSSTFVDLVEERQAVIQTLLQADCLPAGMELFPASDDEKWNLIQRVIDDSDYYVVVIGGRYGSTGDDGLSYTEKEFDYAERIGKPIMGFLHGAPGEIPANKTEIDPTARKALEDFRTKVERRMVKYWKSPAELAGAVALSLIQTRKTHPAEGWIRASRALTPEMERELAELRAQVATLERDAQSKESQAQAKALREELASGEDEYEMNILVYYWTADDVANQRLYDSRRRSFWIKEKISWNDLFSFVAPLLIIEASETEVDAQLDRVARSLRPRRIAEKPDNFGRIAETLASADSVRDFVVQFYSLGLVQESERRHPVGDSNKYWSLTPSGQESLKRLSTYKRADALLDESDAEASTGEEPESSDLTSEASTGEEPESSDLT